MRVAVFRIINKFKYNKILQNVHKKEIRKTKDNNQEKILESKKGCWKVFRKFRERLCDKQDKIENFKSTSPFHFKTFK